jgi:SPP1 gp7 family putative phage head morphogenesis protein
LRYGYDLVRGIIATTRDRIALEVAEYVRNSETIGTLIGRLSEGGLFAPDRAQLIAVTEVTRAFAEGNREAWKASGVIEKRRWRTNADELVCPICGPLAGQVVGLDEEFEGGISGPPAHPRCRCWVTPVIEDVVRPSVVAAEPVAIPEQEPAPVAERRKLVPAGTPVGSALRIPPKSKNRAMYEHVVGVIDATHGDGQLPSTAIHTRKLSPGTFGTYFTRTKNGGPRIDITNESRLVGRDLDLTLVHEIGHFLDHMGVSSTTMMASRDDVATAVWREAAGQSRAIRRLVEQWEKPYDHGVELGGMVSYPNRGYLEYLLSPEEVWARSYAQYIAVRSGDSRLLASIAAERTDPLYGARQWAAADFEPIAAAFDTLFERIGWLR